MRVGVYCDLRNPPAWRRPWRELYARTLARIAEAERLGAGSVWLTEHHLFEDGYLPQPLTFAAAVAARTERVRIGTAVVLAPLRPALQIAEEAAVVDIVSGGRLELGLGAGYRAPEFEAYGADLSRRFELLEERAREVCRLWRAGICTPPPLQKSPPLWLGMLGPRGAHLAGRLGAGLLSLDRALLGPYQEGLAEGGHGPESARMGGLANILLADDPEAARERIRPHHAYQRSTYRRYAAEGVDEDVQPTPPPSLAPDRATGDPLRRLQVLAPEEAERVLRSKLDGLPATDVFLWESIAGMPDDLADRHVELVAARLAPALGGEAV